MVLQLSPCLMADRRAINKYYPPDWDPSKGSINKFRGQHPLRERARKLNEGILIIRFEIPFNIWCLGCERHIARGVRFNAEKKQIGKYHSTPIYSFRMKCPSCSQWIEIHTDPKNAEYLVVAGGRRKIEEWNDDEGDEANGNGNVNEKEANSDPFARIEHQVRDQKRADAAKPRLSALKDAKDSAYKDDWAASQRLRKHFRTEKAIHNEAVAVAEDIRRRGGFNLKLLPEQEEDIKTAETIQFVRRKRDAARAKDTKLATLPKLDLKLVKKK